MAGPWTFYITLRALISPVDFITDTIHAIYLIYNGHPIWGTLTILLPLFAIAVASIYVLVGKCQRGDPMTCLKFGILTVTILTQLFEALFESIPQLVLQCTAVWRGVVKFEAVFRDPDFWGVFSLFSIGTSFISIIITASYYNDEKWDQGRSASKFLISLGVLTSAVLFRIFLGSLLFAVTPYWAFGLIFIFYLTHFIVYKANGHDWDCILYSYTSLIFPSGYTKNIGNEPSRNFKHLISVRNTSVQSNSEVKRVRLNQDRLWKQCQISFGLFNLFNLLSLIIYIALVETHLFSEHHKVNLVILHATNRLILYLVPITLLIINAALSCAYVYHVKSLRDAVRTWDAITPSVPRSANHTSSNSRTSSIVRSSNVSSSTPGSPGSLPPPYYEQQLPLNPSVQPNAPPPGTGNNYSGTGNNYSGTGNSSSAPATAAYPNSLDQNNGGKIQIISAPPSAPKNLPKPGNRKCGRDNCVTCDLVITGSSFRSTMTGKDYKFMPNVGCETNNIIYMITCQKCKKQYVGKTAQTLKQRHYGHRREIDKQSSHLGLHFAGPCGYNNLRIQIIDHTTSSDGLQRREGYWQHELMTLLPWGLNTRDELSGVDVMELSENQA